MFFSSKRDPWLGFWIWTSLIIAFLIVARLSFHQGRFDYAGVLLFIPIFAFTAWIWYGTYYRVEKEHLKIRSGPLRWLIPFSSITFIGKTRSIISAPALSLDRLEIRYGRGRSICVSPLDQKEFVQAIAKRWRGQTPKQF